MDELKRDLEHVRREAMTRWFDRFANRKCFDDEIDNIIQDSSERQLSIWSFDA